MPSYITNHRARLEQRHYITDATVESMWFNFYEGKLREYIDSYGYAFCVVINGSTIFDHAFILPFKDCRGFFSPEFLDATHRWVGNVRPDDEVIRVSEGGRTKEMYGHEYHNAFHLLQDAPLPLPKDPDTSEYT